MVSVVVHVVKWDNCIGNEVETEPVGALAPVAHISSFISLAHMQKQCEAACRCICFWILSVREKVIKLSFWILVSLVPAWDWTGSETLGFSCWQNVFRIAQQGKVLNPPRSLL